MPRFAMVNAIVIALSIMAMACVYAYDLLTQKKQDGELSYLDYPFLRSAFWYFLFGLICVFALYWFRLLDGIEEDLPQRGREFFHQLIHISATVLSNVANASILIAAIAYARGKDFSTSNAKRWLGIFAILIAFWAISLELAHHEKNLFLTLLLIAPDVVLSSLAIIVLGWVFLCRWSGVGVLYFVVALIYAILQSPARLAIDVKSFFIQTEFNLNATFYLLAVGKIFLVGGFILILRKVTNDIERPRAWPYSPRTSPYSVREGALALLFAFIAAFVIEGARAAAAAAGIIPE